MLASTPSYFLNKLILRDFSYQQSIKVSKHKMENRRNNPWGIYIYFFQHIPTTTLGLVVVDFYCACFINYTVSLGCTIKKKYSMFGVQNYPWFQCTMQGMGKGALFTVTNYSTHLERILHSALSFKSPEVFYFSFTLITSWIHKVWVLTCSFPLIRTKGASLDGAGWASAEPRSFSLASFFFWSFSFTHFRKLSQLLVFNIFNTHIYSLGKNHALNLFTTMPTACWVTL